MKNKTIISLLDKVDTKTIKDISARFKSINKE